MNASLQYIGLQIGITLFTLCMLVFGVLAVYGWPGGPDTCFVPNEVDGLDQCYCETLRSGLIKQVANTWSNLGFVIVGLSLLLIAGKDKVRSDATNSLSNGSSIAILFGSVIVLMGPGSMFFHASMVDWAGFIDSTSMFLLLFFIIGYNLYQVTSSALFSWLSWIISLAITVSALTLVILIPEIAAEIFIAFAVLTALIDLVVHLASRLKRSWKWYFSFLGVFSIAIVIWVMSGTGMPLCIEDAVFLQGHAWWHLLSAVSMIFLFFYYRSENGGRLPDTLSDNYS